MKTFISPTNKEPGWSLRFYSIFDECNSPKWCQERETPLARTRSAESSKKDRILDATSIWKQSTKFTRVSIQGILCTYILLQRQNFDYVNPPKSLIQHKKITINHWINSKLKTASISKLKRKWDTNYRTIANPAKLVMGHAQFVMGAKFKHFQQRKSFNFFLIAERKRD